VPKTQSPSISADGCQRISLLTGIAGINTSPKPPRHPGTPSFSHCATCLPVPEGTKQQSQREHCCSGCAPINCGAHSCQPTSQREKRGTVATQWVCVWVIVARGSESVFVSWRLLGLAIRKSLVKASGYTIHQQRIKRWHSNITNLTISSSSNDLPVC